MNYAYKTNTAVYKFSKLKICFSQNHCTYSLNGSWINEIDEKHFKEKIENIKELLHKHLTNGLRHKEFLQDLIDITHNSIDFLNQYNYHTSEFLDFYSNRIKYEYDIQKAPNSNSELYERYKNDFKHKNQKEAELFGFLELHASKLNDYKTQLDFEKGLLLNALSIYKNYQDVPKTI